MSITFTLLILLIGALVLLGLQVALCLLKPVWPGLVLPALCLGYAVFMAMNVAAVGSLLEIAVTMALTFLLCRKGRSSKKQLDKMNIQDL